MFLQIQNVVQSPSKWNYEESMTFSRNENSISLKFLISYQETKKINFFLDKRGLFFNKLISFGQKRNWKPILLDDIFTEGLEKFSKITFQEKILKKETKSSSHSRSKIDDILAESNPFKINVFDRKLKKSKLRILSMFLNFVAYPRFFHKVL